MVVFFGRRSLSLLRKKKESLGVLEPQPKLTETVLIRSLFLEEDIFCCLFCFEENEKLKERL